MGTTGDKSRIRLCAMGDVLPNRNEPEKLFGLCFDALKVFDVRLCQLETNFSEKGSLSSTARGAARAHPSNVGALNAAGINIVTFAGNHTMDYGAEGMLDTINLLRKNCIAVIGAGKNLDEAKRPLILELKGMTLAFLDYCSILGEGCWAGASRPGVAGLRVETQYEMLEPNQPGCPARVLTHPNKEDISAMLENIKKAKSMADIVILSMHWGLHFVPVKLASYQRLVGHSAIDAGADIIIGTHAHILKGIEIYKGKVVFYSLGNFALDSNRRHWPKGWPESTPEQREIIEAYNLVMNPAWVKTYPYPAASRKTMLVKCIISDKRIERVSFLPAKINIDARPQILLHGEKEFDEVVQYMTEVTEKACLNAKYTVEGDEVLVSG